MDHMQDEYFGMLTSGPCIPDEYLLRYYGLRRPFSPAAEKAYTRYVGTLRRPDSCQDDYISRYDLEGFLSRGSLLSKKWMGAQLGMEEESLSGLLEMLDVLGMQRSRYELGEEFIADSLSEDLVRHIPALRFRTFGSHNDFCKRLHDELARNGLDVKRLFCATSKIMEEEPVHYAAYFDCLTWAPLSVAHSTWLNFGKPINLAPDRCSKLFYVENRELLKPYLMGSEEADRLAEYEKRLVVHQQVA